ncbi:MAG: hypothetical protein ABI675_07405 [Chitinophagaceae bacterium]
MPAVPGDMANPIAIGTVLLKSELLLRKDNKADYIAYAWLYSSYIDADILVKPPLLQTMSAVTQSVAKSNL